MNTASSITQILRLLRLPSLALVALGLLQPAAHATSANWNGTSSTTWATGGNWSATPAPGTGDTATFNNAGKGNTTLNLGSGVTINTIVFDTALAAAYTIGSGAVGSQTLILNNGGAITANSTISQNQLVNAAITLGTDATAQTYAFTDSSGTQSLTFAGGITGGASGTAGTKTLTISAAASGVTVSGVIANGGATAVALSKAGGGTLTLNGSAANTFTGGLTLNAGTLLEDFTALGSTPNLIASGSTLTLSGGSLSLKGKGSGYTCAQTLGNVTVKAGGGAILGNNNGGTSTTITLGSITAATAGGSLLAGTASGSSGATPIITTTSGTLTDGIYNGREVYTSDGGTTVDWATTASGSSPYTLSALGSYSTMVAAATSDSLNDTTGTLTLTGGHTHNSLKLTSGATLALGANTLTLASGGLLSAGTTASTISGTAGATRLTAGNGSSAYELIVHQFNSGGLTINAVIGNNGANATALAKAGSGTLILTVTNTYTGATYVNAGTLGLQNQSAIQSSTLTMNGGSLVFDSSVTGNAFTFGGLAAPLAGGGYDLALQNNAGSPAAIALTVGGNNASTTYAGVLSDGGLGGSLTKVGTGALSLSGANTYTGGTVISAGTLSCGVAQDNSFLGGTAGSVNVTVQSGATLSLNRNTMTGTLTMNGGTLVTGNSFSSYWNGSIILGATSSVNLGTSGNMSLGAAISGSGGLTKLGSTSSPLYLTGDSTFTGPVAVNAGALSVASLNSVSGGTATSNLGAPTDPANATISLGATTTAGTLLYTGPGENTDRGLKLAGTTGGATLSQAGTASGLALTQTGQSGLLKITGNVSAPGTAGADNRKTLTLNQVVSGNTGFVMGRGELAGSISDSVLGNAGQLATSVTMAGPGTWTLSGKNTYTGATKVQAGVLLCTDANALGAGTLDITTGARLELDYVGTRQVAALTFDGGASQPNGTYGSSSSIAATKDDVHFAGLGTVTVGAIASETTNTLALTSGANPSSGGAPVTFTATVTGGNAPSGNVVFYDGLTSLGTSALNSSFQAAFSTSILTGGVHTITSLYLGNASNASSASAPLSQSVVDSRPATTTTLTLTGGANPSSLGAAVTFRATVTGATPTGSVSFYEGTAWLGSSALNGSAQASLTTSALPSGWRGITARYLGDANNAPSASPTPFWQTVKPPAGNGKLKVFILAGQSNMQGKGSVEKGRDPNNFNSTTLVGGYGSLRHMLNANANIYSYLADTNHPTANGDPGWRVMTNVWVSYWTDGFTGEARKGYLDAGDFGDVAEGAIIGPEYGFGLVAGSQLGDPVLLIKTAWGGRSLAVDFRPPSSGGTVGPYYTNMIGIVHSVLNNLGTEFTNFNYSGGGYELAGFVWHQGWNDIGEPTRQYETNLVNLIHDVRAEFGVPSLPFAIATTGMSAASGNQLLICAAQAAVANPVLHPELAGTVFTVDTRPFDYGLFFGCSTETYHWFHNAQSYFNVGQSLGLGMMSLLSSPPAVTNAPATGITTSSATLTVTVDWPYTPCNLIAYWNTVNGGTNAAVWGNSAAAASWANTTYTNLYGTPGDYILAGGTWANVVSTSPSYTLTGLTPNTTYYFTFCATNQTVSDLPATNTQTLWATNVQSFSTLAMSLPPPPIPVLPVSGVTVTNGVPSFTFTTAAGCKYRLDYKSVLTDAGWVFGPWSTNSTGGPLPMTLTDPSAAGQPQRFYRLEAAYP